MAGHKYTVADLITMSLEDSPADMQDAFDQLMTGRVKDVVDDYTVEVASSILGTDDFSGDDVEEINADDDEDAE